MDALEQLNLAAPIVSTYSEVEETILCHIVEQLAANPDTLINATSEWRIKMLAQMGRVNKDTARIIASKVGKIPTEVQQVVQSSIDKVLSEHGLEMNGKIEESVAAALKNYDLQAVKDKYNQVNTVMQYKAKQAYVSGINSVADKLLRKEQEALKNSQEYLDILNKNAMATVLGEKSRTEAIRETIAEMSKKGIPAFVDKTGREWSPEAYVDMDIRNTAKNAALAAEFASLDELGQDVILVSSHSGSRPLCAPYQGKLYSRSGKSGTITDAKGKTYTYTPLSDTSFGEAAGLFGINCGHRMRGVSDGTFINREKEFDGEETSEEYKKVQRQRAMEREVRKKKTEANMLEAAGDKDAARDLRRLALDDDRKLRAYCEKEGLHYRRDRTEVYGFKNKVDISENGGIINIKENKDFEQVEKYLSDTYKIKLDDSVKALDFNAVKQALTGAESMMQEFPELAENIQLITTSDEGIMSCNGLSINFNPKFFNDSEKIKNICDKYSADGNYRWGTNSWCVKNTSPESIGVHEMTHALEWQLCKQNPSFSFDWQRIIAFNDCKEAKNIVSEACKNIKKTEYGKGKVNASLIKSISEYATQNPSETMAEAFADCYANGDKANPLSQEIRKLTVEKYKKYKGGV